MDEYRLKLLIDSYGLEYLLDMADVRQEYVLKLLVEDGLIDMTEYFDEMTEGEDE